MSTPAERNERESLLAAALDRARHRIPFWWWITYDALVAVVIVAGIAPSDPAFWLGFGVLGIAVAIDTVEFLVKSPWAKKRLAEELRQQAELERRYTMSRQRG